jgi:hypothetical protein
VQRAGAPSWEAAERDIPVMMKTLYDALDVGVPMYNDGDHAGCARVYCLAGAEILSKHSESTLLHPKLAGVPTEKMVAAVQQTSGTSGWRTAESQGAQGNKNAWAMRAGIDMMLEALSAASEAGAAGCGNTRAWLKLKPAGNWKVVA